MIDFTNCPVKNKTYGGANGSKRSITYNNELFMVKFPPHPTRSKEMSYTNSCISEFIGSHIFNIIGITAQETILGTYFINGEEKIVVACKDFAINGKIIQDFASLKNTVIESPTNGYGTELDDIIDSIEEQQAIYPVELKRHFWNLFIVDAFIGNFDRHNGNWGFLYDSLDDSMKIAPVFDCGSCLFPQASPQIMRSTLSDKNELDLRIYGIPLSGIKENNRKINYFDYIYSLKNKDCNEALKRITPRIDLERINNMIDEIEVLDSLQKNFYKTILAARKEHILDKSLERLRILEHSRDDFLR